MKEKLSRAELSRRAWRNENTRRALLEGAKKAGRTRRERHGKLKAWVCIDQSCQMEVLSKTKPGDREWSTGHICVYRKKRIRKKK